MLIACVSLYQLRDKHGALPVTPRSFGFVNMIATPCDKPRKLTAWKSFNKARITTCITDAEQQSRSVLPFVSFSPLTETRDIMMSALEKLPQQCEICLCSCVMVESVSIRAIPYCIVDSYAAACIIHTSKGHMRISCISLHPKLMQTRAVGQVEVRFKPRGCVLSLQASPHL